MTLLDTWIWIFSDYGRVPAGAGKFATCQLTHNATLPASKIRIYNPRYPQLYPRRSLTSHQAVRYAAQLLNCWIP
jgi:hypothetical protein